MDQNKKLLFAVWILMLSYTCDVRAAGAGRAFPIDSENYVIKQFQSINRNLEWDETNFLIDLSGKYANCKYRDVRGPVQIKETTNTGASLIGYNDYTDGWDSDVNAVNRYITDVVNKWMKSQEVYTQVRLADKFGCSVRPGCEGRVSISCMFSSDQPSNIIEDPNQGDQPGIQRALAFTPQQYDLAEQITGNRWDRSHFLENLSGFETDCAMIGSRSWSFTKLNLLPDGERGYGTFGYSENRGSTPAALVEILKNFKSLKYSKNVGCSLIPDCVIDRQMYVVVSCIYVE